MAQETLNKLKAQHQQILDLLGTAKSFGDKISQEGVEAQVLSGLQTFKNIIVDHLQIEEGTFYPTLYDEMKKRQLDMNIRTAQTFQSSMKPLGEKVMAFLQDYSATGSIKADSVKFTGDLNAIDAGLRMRIKNEENILYPLYQKYCC